MPTRKTGGNHEAEYGEAHLITHLEGQVLRLHADEMHAPNTDATHGHGADEDVTDTYFTVLGFSADTRRGKQRHIRAKSVSYTHLTLPTSDLV